jgi:endoglucanase
MAYDSPGTDAAAAASAAFSACSSLYANRTFGTSYSGPASLQDAAYAQTLLTHAEQLYTFAVNATGGLVTYQSSVPAVSYPSSGFTDDLTLAALFLGWAANSAVYYNEAEAYYKKYGLGGQNGVFNWDSKTPGLAVLFAQMNQATPDFGGNFTKWRVESELYFDNIVNEGGPGYLTNGMLVLPASDCCLISSLLPSRRPAVLS